MLLAREISLCAYVIHLLLSVAVFSFFYFFVRLTGPYKIAFNSCMFLRFFVRLLLSLNKIIEQAGE